MAKIRRVDFSPDEWIAGTRELTLEERGAYWDVCALIYSRGGPIADDEAWIAKALTCHVRTWRAIRAQLIAKGKLIARDGMLSNGRSLREIKRAEGRLKSSRDAAEESAKTRRERAENADLSNDYNDIPEAAASDFGGAIQQRATIKGSDREKLTGETSTAPAGAGAGERGDSDKDQAGSRKARTTARGTRLPDSWQPGPELEQFARNLGLDPDAVTPEFVDHWRGVAGQRGVKLDWPATYRNRCRFLAGRTAVAGTKRPQDIGRSGYGSKSRGQAETDNGESTTTRGVAAAFARRSVQPG